jgi:hypothetical protein
MSFKIVENLTPKEKERRRQEYTAWLHDNNFMYKQLEEESDKPLLQARSLTQELIRDLQSINLDTQAALKLAANIQEILNTIK